MRIQVDQSKNFDRDKTEDGWKLKKSDDGPSGWLDLTPCPFSKPGEGQIDGSALGRRAVELRASHNQKVAEAMLASQSLIPHDWTRLYLVFPGTVWENEEGTSMIPYLGHDSETGLWSMYFAPLERPRWSYPDSFVRTRPM